MAKFVAVPENLWLDETVIDPETGDVDWAMTAQDLHNMQEAHAEQEIEAGYVRWLETRDDDYYRWCDQVEASLGRIF
jgi:hypothetical protein